MNLERDFARRVDAFSADLLVSTWLRELSAPVSIFRIADEVVYDASRSLLSFVFRDHDIGAQVLFHLESLVAKSFPYTFSCDLDGTIVISYPLVSLFARFTSVRPVKVSQSLFRYAKPY